MFLLDLRTQLSTIEVFTDELSMIGKAGEDLEEQLKRKLENCETTKVNDSESILGDLIPTPACLDSHTSLLPPCCLSMFKCGVHGYHEGCVCERVRGERILDRVATVMGVIVRATSKESQGVASIHSPNDVFRPLTSCDKIRVANFVNESNLRMAPVFRVRPNILRGSGDVQRAARRVH